MIKTVLIAIALVVIFNAIFVFSGGLSLLVKTEQIAEPENSVHAEIIDVFRFTLEDEVRKKVGVPVEGYEPAMFLKVFPGLVETDFDGVESSIGGYIIEEGRLSHKLDQSKLVHSAAQAMTRPGFTTLLENVSQRIGVNLSSDGTITDIMSALTSEG